MNAVPTLICAYCNAARPPGATCPCRAQHQVSAARTRELQTRYALERAGIAPKDTKQYVKGRN